MADPFHLRSTPTAETVHGVDQVYARGDGETGLRAEIDRALLGAFF